MRKCVVILKEVDNYVEVVRKDLILCLFIQYEMCTVFKISLYKLDDICVCGLPSPDRVFHFCSCISNKCHFTQMGWIYISGTV